MNKMQISIKTESIGAESSAFMREFMFMIKEQASDHEISVLEETVSVPSTKGVVLSELLLTIGFEVAKDVAVALLVRLANDLIDKFFTKKEAKSVSVTESPNGIVITNSGDNNSYNVIVQVMDD